MKYPDQKFVLQVGFEDRGVRAICRNAQYRFERDPNNVQESEIPYGTVEWTESILGKTIEPDFFPAFLHDHIHRQWRYSTDWPLGERCFIKPAYKHKAWSGRVYEGRGYKGKKRGPYLISEVTRFRNEYRYYVANGRVLSGWWYWGDTVHESQIHEGEDPPDAPKLPDSIDWPAEYCGAVDFGELHETGDLALIEANAPFACGWYGEKTHELEFLEFLTSGWSYLNPNRRDTRL